ncbi:PREDICTED: putative glycerol kinase 5 [Nicrophorus vespilloides]|uniref:Glycerol kinase 5 n=1 Tax=Nicrophorus vespilloides TaxID=110193 RepID=A0ABM1N3G0_NICVS|nr:PREDICTED: putative glycerol kinase 5 [Nicrophorus vespilloides]
MFERNGEKYVATLDVGTTTLRCLIVNSKAEIVGSASTGMKLVYPQPGFVEIDPDVLWEDVMDVIKEAISSASLSAADVSCIGISTQRGTFITWRKDTGKHFHNFITWKDMRSLSLVKEWNNSIAMKSLRSSAYMLYLLTRNKRWLAGSNLMLNSTQTTLRLMWMYEDIPELRGQTVINNVMFGTLDTWLLYKFTSGRTYATDYTNASATGFFDPFVLDWSSWAHTILKLPKNILPPIVNNDYDIGSTSEHIFGASIPIKCVIADQQASMFGSCCFTNEILKVTLGTGSFLDIQTNVPHGSCNGLYPLIARILKDKIYYTAEGSCNDTGSLIQWALTNGLVKDAKEIAPLVMSVDSNDGVYFVPAFSGLGYPFCDDKTASGFLGIKPTTKKAHMLRAILESIVFRIVLQYELMKKEIKNEIETIYVDGGVSNNEFVCQLLADMSRLPVEKPRCSEMSAMGAAFIAGLNQGIWDSAQDIIALRDVEKTYIPTTHYEVVKRNRAELEKWTQVCHRFKTWY